LGRRDPLMGGCSDATKWPRGQEARGRTASREAARPLQPERPTPPAGGRPGRSTPGSPRRSRTGHAG
jgi:hypothetical protein